MKCALALCVVLCLSVSMASADYFNPPGWDNNPYFTHQGWGFAQGLPPYLPQVPSPGYVSPGTPLATRMAGSWLNDLGMGRQGGWQFGGGTTGLLATIYCPNVADPKLQKELWFQATVKTNDISNLGLGIDVYDDAGSAFSLTNLTVQPFATDPTGGGTWAYVTGMYAMVPQPVWETVLLTGSLGPNQYLIIDQIDVDTRCVPEPSTIVMLLGVGVLGWIGWRRRK
jgi:hypothetical protein